MEFGYTTLALRSMFVPTTASRSGARRLRTDEQKSRWLEGIASGESCVLALTESGAGSNPAGLRTKAIGTARDRTPTG